MIQRDITESQPVWVDASFIKIHWTKLLIFVFISGYLSDPEEIPGIAHFCEHMLFLGTEKYPQENDYSKFLSEHGGGSNACTYLDHTSYYFDIIPEQLESALDR